MIGPLLARLSLRRKYLLASCVTILCASGLGYLDASHELETDAAAWSQERSVGQAELLARSLAPGLDFHDHAYLADTLLSLDTTPGARAAAVYDKQGRPVATWGDEAIPASLQTIGSKPIARIGSGGIVTQVPIAGHMQRGTLWIQSDRTELDSLHAFGFHIAARVTLLWMCLIFLGAVWTSHRVVSPLERLTALVRRLQRGDFEVNDPTVLRLAGRGAESGCQDEVATLGRGLVELAAALSTYEDDLKSALDRVASTNVRLEKKVSERTRDLESARRAAVDASEAKSTFLAQMSHELRTPMHGMLGMARILRTQALAPQQAEAVDTIVQSGEALLALLNDVLDVARIEAGRVDISTDPVDLKDVLDELVRLNRPVADAKDLELRLEVSAEVPTWVLGDRLRIRQVLQNLMSNALKFTHEGGVRLRVTRADADDDTLRFEVIDSGIGIPPEAQARIWEAFGQADASTTRRFGGTGLGLGICRSLTHLMGGRIDMQSAPGLGTTFWFEIPLPETAPADTDASAENELPTLPSGLRVLVVDDNPINRLVGRRALETLGCTPTLASTGEEALRELHNQDIDVVLMDCHMAGLDGYETTERIRGSGAPWSHIPVIAMTASSVDAIRRKALQAGMSGFLAKPFGLADLARTLESCTSPTAGPTL